MYEWESGGQFIVSANDIGVPRELRIGRREGLNRIDAIVFHEDGTLTDQELDGLFAIADPALLGDVNLDDAVTFADIFPFIQILSNSSYQNEADFDQNGFVNFLDISPFIVALSSQP